MGIFLFDKKIITVHEFSCPFVLDIVNHPENITSINSLLIRIIQEITKTFFVETIRLEEEVNKIEERIGTSASKAILEKLFKVRKDLVFLVRSISGNRDVINNMISNASMFRLNKLEKLDLSEIHTDQIQLAETMAIYREILSNAVEIYNSKISHEMNKIIQRLTIVGSFILFPTLIASIYGMNFKPDISPYNMPELNWKYGYIFSLGLMAISIIGTYTYFKIKKWV
jgi:magnesium transporter